MDLDVFWKMIGPSDDGSLSERTDDLPDRLTRFRANQIKVFDVPLHEMNHRAYRNDMWALAYLLRGGCSDDEFEGFRCGLIMLGQERFEGVIADPDSFDVAMEVGTSHELMDVPLLAHELRAGKPLKRKVFRVLDLARRELEEGSFSDVLPRVAAAVAT